MSGVKDDDDVDDDDNEDDDDDEGNEDDEIYIVSEIISNSKALISMYSHQNVYIVMANEAFPYKFLHTYLL